MKAIALLILLSFSMIGSVACSQFVTSGLYKISQGTVSTGNLIVTSGEVIIEEDAILKGSVIMTSGVLIVNGTLRGDVLRASGTVKVGKTGVIDGQIKSLSGDTKQEEGGQILGNQIDNGGLDFTTFVMVAATTMFALFFGWSHIFNGSRAGVKDDPFKAKH